MPGTGKKVKAQLLTISGVTPRSGEPRLEPQQIGDAWCDTFAVRTTESGPIKSTSSSCRRSVSGSETPSPDIGGWKVGIIAPEKQAKLQCPTLLLNHTFELAGVKVGRVNVSSWHEGSTREMMNQSMVTLARLYETEFDTSISVHDESATNDEPTPRRLDFVFRKDTARWAPIELKTGFAAPAPVWNAFPFSGLYLGLARTAPFTQGALGSSFCVINQIFKYSLDIQVEGEGALLFMILCTPTVAQLCYVDFVAKRITLSGNLLNSPIIPGKKMVNLIRRKDNWVPVYRTLLFFIPFSAYVGSRHDVFELWLKQSKGKEDQSGHQLLTALIPIMEEAVQALGEPAPIGLWEWTFWLVYQLTLFVGSMIQVITDGWRHRLGLFRMAWVVKGRTWGERLGQVGRLRLEDGSCLIIHHQGNIPNAPSISASLPGGQRLKSHHYNKRFYVYRDLGIFIKMFDHLRSDEFEAEKELYNKLSDLQGSVIPNWYACGRVEHTREFFIVISYEGEPVQAVDDEIRLRIAELVQKLHRGGFHHHDIRKDNVVVNEAGDLKLIDFGLSEYHCLDSGCDDVDDLE